MPPAVSSVQSLSQQLLEASSILASIFGSFLQLRFQSGEASLFDTHRLHILAFFTVLVICTVSRGIEIKLEAADSGCPVIVSTVFLLTGSLALILLLLIIEPYVGWPVLIVWFLYFVKLACESYKEIRDSTVSAVEFAANILKNLFNFLKTLFNWNSTRTEMQTSLLRFKPIVSAVKRAANHVKSLFSSNSNQNGDANQSTTV